MNPLTKVKLINELNEREVQLGVAEKVSWHSEYKDSAWVFLGGLPYELTEGDIICVFSQYGEIVNINLVRDKKTGKSKGFCFLCYEDQRSTVLAVDNFNGIKIKGRTIRVDHVANYRAPQESEDVDDVTRELQEKGCGAKTPPPSPPEVSEDEDAKVTKKPKKDKKEKKKKKEKEKTERPVRAEPPSCSRSKTVKETDEQSAKKHSSKPSERAQKSECRERKKSHSGSPDVRTSCRGRAEDPEWEAKKEKHKHEHKPSSRREGEEKSRDKDRGRSSGTHSSRHHGHSEGRSRRSRSRSRSRNPDRSHRHKKHRHSHDRESFHASDRRRY